MFVKGMSGTERDAFEASILEMRGKTSKINTVNIRAKLCALSICDEGGKLLFSAADVKKLGKKSAQALDHVFEVAQRLSAITNEDVEELAEEMDASPSSGSASD